jgi:chromosome segregation ATPase
VKGTNVKKIALFILVLFALSLLGSRVFAQPGETTETIEQTLTTLLAKPSSVQEKIGVVHDLLQTAANNRVSLKAEGAIGLTKLADINTQTTNYEATVEKHNVAIANFQTRMKSQNDRATQHNAAQCTYYDGRVQDCAAYNAEQDALNTEGAALDQEKIVLNKEKGVLDAAGDGLQLIINDYNKWKDSFNLRNDTNEHNISVLMRVLDMLKRTNQPCQAALQDPKTTPEQLSEACGQQSDGNNAHPPLTHGGTGGVTPNSSQPPTSLHDRT